MKLDVSTYGTALDAHRSVIDSFKRQLSLLEDDEKKLKKAYLEDFNKELRSNTLFNSEPFTSYLSKTVGQFPTLKNCYYYEKGPGYTTLREHLFELLNTGVQYGRVFITLPKKALPVKRLLKFFREINVTIEQVPDLSIFIQSIPKTQGDHNGYICFHLCFRESCEW